MRVKTQFRLLNGSVIAALALLAVLSVITLQLFAELNQAQLRRYQSYVAAEELRRSSDELTRFARTFVVTADPQWERRYRRTLAIRNGEEPRPDDRILYPGETIPLRVIMSELGFTDEELALLEESQAKSDRLVRIERVAMNAVKGIYEDIDGDFSIEGQPRPAYARELVLNQEYHKEKARIMEPINEFENAVDERTSAQVRRLERRNRFIRTIVLVITLVAAGLMILSYYVIARRLVEGLGGEPAEIVTAASLLAHGDLTEAARRDSGRTGAVGDLKAGMHELRNLVAGIKAQSRQTLRQTEQTSEALQDLVQHMTVAGRTVESVRSGSKDFDNQAETVEREVGSLADDVESLSRRINDQVSMVEESGSAVEELIASINSVSDIVSARNADAASLEQVTERTQEQLESSNERMQAVAAVIGSVQEAIEVINAVSEQTNLLSMNAAIEAAHAGEAGRGFAVVAEEIRKLAESTAENATTIGGMLKQVVEDVHTSGDRTSESLAGMHDVSEWVTRVVAAFQEIDGTLSEMATGSQQVLTTTGELRDVTSRIGEISSDLDHRSGTVREFVSTFRRLSRENVEQLTEVEKNVSAGEAAIDRVEQSSRSAADIARALRNRVDRFST